MCELPKFFPDIFCVSILYLLRNTTHRIITHIIAHTFIQYSTCVLNLILPQTLLRHIKFYADLALRLLHVTTNFFLVSRQHLYIFGGLKTKSH
jgi:hypothetical protein